MAHQYPGQDASGAVRPASDPADRGPEAGVGWAGPPVLTEAWLHAVNNETTLALEAADRLVAAAGEARDAQLCAEAHFVAALAYVNDARPDESLARLDAALACPDLGPVPGFRAAVQTVRAAALLSADRFDEAFEAVYLAEHALARVGDPGAREANAYANIALCRSRAELFEAADRAYARVGRLDRALGLPRGSELHGRGENLLLWGMRLEHLGRHDEAAQRFEASRRMFVRALGEPRRGSYDAEQDIAVVGAVLAAHRPLGRTAEAGCRPGLDEAEAAAARSSLPEAGPWLAQATAAVLLSRGDPDAALAVTRGVQDPSAGLWRTLEADRLFVEASCHEARGDDAAALEAYKAFHRLYDEKSWLARHARAGAARARVERSELAAEAQRLTHDTLTDALTGLANRRRLDGALAELRNRADALPLTLAVLDIDEFKRVNDTYGHSVGDAVLTAVGGVLRRECREADLVVRYAGDEFVLLLPGLDAPDAAALRDRVEAATAAHPWAGLAPGLHVSLTCGVTTTDACPLTAELFDRADADMLTRKHARLDALEQPPAQRPFDARTAS